MKRIFLILLLAMIGSATPVRTWNSSGDTVATNGDNYTPTGPLLATDSLVFSSASVVKATKLTAWHIKALTVLSTYTSTLDLGTFNDTIDGCVTLKNKTAYVVWHGSLLKNGVGDILFDTLGKLNLTGLNIDFRGSGSFTCRITGNTYYNSFHNFDLAYPGDTVHFLSRYSSWNGLFDGVFTTHDGVVIFGPNTGVNTLGITATSLEPFNVSPGTVLIDSGCNGIALETVKASLVNFNPPIPSIYRYDLARTMGWRIEFGREMRIPTTVTLAKDLILPRYYNASTGKYLLASFYIYTTAFLSDTAYPPPAVVYTADHVINAYRFNTAYYPVAALRRVEIHLGKSLIDVFKMDFYDIDKDTSFRDQNTHLYLDSSVSRLSYGFVLNCSATNATKGGLKMYTGKSKAIITGRDSIFVPFALDTACIGYTGTSSYGYARTNLWFPTIIDSCHHPAKVLGVRDSVNDSCDFYIHGKFRQGGKPLRIFRDYYLENAALDTVWRLGQTYIGRDLFRCPTTIINDTSAYVLMDIGGHFNHQVSGCGTIQRLIVRDNKVHSTSIISALSFDILRSDSGTVNVQANTSVTTLSIADSFYVAAGDTLTITDSLALTDTMVVAGRLVFNPSIGFSYSANARIVPLPTGSININGNVGYPPIDTIPVFISCTPMASPLAGGAVLKMRITNARLIDSLNVGGSLVTPDSAQVDTLWALIPAHAAGTVSIQSIARYGYRDTVTGFVYAAIHGQLLSGRAKCGDTGTITASWGLTGITHVHVGDSSATALEGASDTQVRFLWPCYSSGKQDVTATATAGTVTFTAGANYSSGRRGGVFGLFGGWMGF